MEQFLNFIPVEFFNEIITKFSNEILNNINVIFILCYIIGGYLGKSSKLNLLQRFNNRIKTIIFGTTLSIVYMIIMYVENNPIPISHIFWSYLIATTVCYDLIIKWFEKKFKSNPDNYTSLTFEERNNLDLDLLDPDIIIYQIDEIRGFYKLNSDQTKWIYIGNKIS